MSFAQVADIEVDFGPITETDTRTKTQTLIERAEARIEQAFGQSLTELIAAGRTTPVLAKQVVSEMVSSVLRNPNGWQSESETIGGLSRSHTVNLAAASGLLRLTDDHRTLLVGDHTRGAFTINPWQRVTSPWQ